MLRKDQWDQTPFEISLGTFALSGISAADLVTDYPVPTNCEVVALRTIVVVAPTTSNKAATVTLKRKRGGTLATVTGVSSSLTTSSLATKGTVVSATPTGENSTKRLQSSDTISLVGSSVTAFVEGSVQFNLVLKRIESI